MKRRAIWEMEEGRARAAGCVCVCTDADVEAVVRRVYVRARYGPIQSSYIYCTSAVLAATGVRRNIEEGHTRRVSEVDDRIVSGEKKRNLSSSNTTRSTHATSAAMISTTYDTI